MNVQQLRSAGFRVERLGSSFYEIVTPLHTRIQVDFNSEVRGDKWLVANLTANDGFYVPTRAAALTAVYDAHRVAA